MDEGSARNESSLPTAFYPQKQRATKTHDSFMTEPFWKFESHCASETTPLLSSVNTAFHRGAPGSARESTLPLEPALHEDQTAMSHLTQTPLPGRSTLARVRRDS